MSMFEDTNPRELKELLRQIQDRESVLPEFQRDFVWDPSMTQELITSIAQNYPAGSILRIRNTHDLFANRSFQGAPTLNGKKPTFLVLDGQQRLTSLYQAFYGVGEHRYFLNVGALLTGAEFEEAIFHLKRNDKKAVAYEQAETQARDLIMPLSLLKGGSGDSLHWILSVAAQARTSDEQVTLQRALLQVEQRWVRTIDDYRFPVVTLSDSTSAEAVCTIFETLNRTGVKLSVFELLTARFWPKKVNLRQLWDEATQRYPILADYWIDPYYVLQAIAIITHKTSSATRGAVLDLSASAITQWWDQVVLGFANGLRMLQEECGVIAAKWLPYNTLVLPLSAVMATVETDEGPQVAAKKHKLERWFWCSVFGQMYENSTNSQATKDYAELLAWLQGGDPPESVRTFGFDPRILHETTTRQRALYRGAMCLALRRGPRDFHRGDKLDAGLIVERGVDDHHIFPYAYLGRQVNPPAVRLRDCILNRTLIDAKTNKRISDRAPSEYMQEIQQELETGSFAELLDSHLLPTGPDSPLWRDDFDGFLEWRQDVFWREIRHVTGATEAAELIVEEATA